MVIHPHRPPARAPRAWMITELVVGVAIIGVVLLPIAFGFLMEMRAVRESYFDVVIMEVVDGEMEILAAGEVGRFPIGEHEYPVTAAAVRNLPGGSFRLTRGQHHLRLEWIPATGVRHRRHVREVALP